MGGGNVLEQRGCGASCHGRGRWSGRGGHARRRGSGHTEGGLLGGLLQAGFRCVRLLGGSCGAFRSVLEGVRSSRGSRGGGGFPGVWDAHAVQSSSPLDQSPSFVTVCNAYYYSMINNSIYYIEYRMNNDN